MFGPCGHGEVLGGVVGQHIVHHQHAEKGTQARNNAALGGNGNARLVELLEKGMQVLFGDVLRLNPQRLCKTAQKSDIMEISLHRIVGQVALETQLCFKLPRIARPVHNVIDYGRKCS